MPPFWHILVAVALAVAFWYTINMLILLGMENLVRLAVHLTLAIYLSFKIAAAIGWILDQIDP